MSDSWAIPEVSAVPDASETTGTEPVWPVGVTGRDVREFTVAHRLYSAYEPRRPLERVGFDDVTAYGDLEGGVYDQDAEQLVVVARKRGPGESEPPPLAAAAAPSPPSGSRRPRATFSKPDAVATR